VAVKSQFKVAFVLTLLTFCPPGPGDLEYENFNSLAGIEILEFILSTAGSQNCLDYSKEISSERGSLQSVWRLTGLTCGFLTVAFAAPH
jgi:hypothetical protein